MMKQSTKAAYTHYVTDINDKMWLDLCRQYRLNFEKICATFGIRVIKYNEFDL